MYLSLNLLNRSGKLQLRTTVLQSTTSLATTLIILGLIGASFDLVNWSELRIESRDLSVRRLELLS